MTEINDRQHEIERRARLLQAEGPDEYPWGYYLHLAERQVEENVDMAERLEAESYSWPQMAREIWPTVGYTDEDGVSTR